MQSHLKWPVVEVTETLHMKCVSPLPWLRWCGGKESDGSQDCKTKLDFSFHRASPLISMGEASLWEHNGQTQRESVSQWTMSLAAQSIFKLHEKFMSFMEVTSTHYHHILPCLGNRSLLGTGEDGRREVSVKKNHQHTARPSSVITTSRLTYFTNWDFYWHLGEGEATQKSPEPIACSLHLPAGFSIIF